MCDSLTYEEVAELYSQEFLERDEDKLNYRYHKGESYVDIIERLHPVIYEIERMEGEETLLIVAHQAVIRCLYSYLMEGVREEIPYLNIPLHTLISLSWDGDWVEERFDITKQKIEI